MMQPDSFSLKNHDDPSVENKEGDGSRSDPGRRTRYRSKGSDGDGQDQVVDRQVNGLEISVGEGAGELC